MAAFTCRRIPCKITELRLDKTLVCGQSFRWKERSPGVWTGVLAGYVWNLWQNETELFYQVFPSHNRQHIEQQNTADGDVEIKTDLTNENHKNCSISGGFCANDTNTILDTVIKTEKQDQITDEDIIVSKCTKQTKRKGIKLKNIKSEEPNLGEKCSTLSPKDTSVGENKDMPIKSDVIDIQGKIETTMELELILQDYFRLDVNLGDLYETWSQADPVFKRTAVDFTGMRILRQDPVENLFSFICSSNNHISRISGMVERLCQTYGSKITEVDGETYYNFPSVESLAGDGVEEKLRELGFGYRAKYISVTSQYIQDKYSEAWLRGLRDRSYTDAKAELVKMCGVGAKVADCVCLMSLDKLEAVPVDTHVWQIAARDYIPQLKQAKSLTDKLYSQIVDHFHGLWGDKAGWAHTVLFAADLKRFKKQPEEFYKNTVEKKSPTKGYKRPKSSDRKIPSKGKKAR